MRRDHKAKVELLKEIIQGRRSLDELIEGHSYIVISEGDIWTVMHYITKEIQFMNTEGYVAWKAAWKRKFGKSKHNILFEIS